MCKSPVVSTISCSHVQMLKTDFFFFSAVNERGSFSAGGVLPFCISRGHGSSQSTFMYIYNFNKNISVKAFRQCVILF